MAATDPATLPATAADRVRRPGSRDRQRRRQAADRVVEHLKQLPVLDPGLRRVRPADVTFGGVDELRIGAPTLVEIGIVMSGRLGAGGLRDLDGWLRAAAIEEVAFTARHREIAVDAFYRFGKGRHPAALNFGDCMSYAVAIDRVAPLLFVGGAFRRTDVRSALPHDCSEPVTLAAGSSDDRSVDAWARIPSLAGTLSS